MSQSSLTLTLDRSNKKKCACFSTDTCPIKRKPGKHTTSAVLDASRVIDRLLILFEAGSFREFKFLFSPLATYCISGGKTTGLFWKGRSAVIQSLRNIRQHMFGKVTIRWRIVENRGNTAKCIWHLMSRNRSGVPYQNSGTLKVHIRNGVIVTVEETLNLYNLRKLVGRFEENATQRPQVTKRMRSGDDFE